MTEPGRIENPSLKLEQSIREQIEHTRAYERSPEAPIERVESTTFPQEVRVAVRDAIYSFIDAPVGLGDNWGMQRLYSQLEDREKYLRRAFPDKKGASAALGFNAEPWRAPSLITEEQEMAIKRSLIDSPDFIDSTIEELRREAEKFEGSRDKFDQKTDGEKHQLIEDALEVRINTKVAQYQIEVEKRVPFLRSELLRSQGELSRTRRIVFMWWNWRNAASGSEIGQWYMDSKIPNYPVAIDFALLFKDPAALIPPDEEMDVPIGGGKTEKKKANSFPGHPTEEQIPAFLEVEGKKENLPVGELAQRETRLFYLISLSENPERVMEWKLRAEREALFKILKNRGVNDCYLTLKEKGIDFLDAEEERKIQGIIQSLSDEEKKGIRDAWWKQFGFKGEEDGIDQIGDPALWIPRKARRGEVPADIISYLEPGFNREDEEIKIESVLQRYKKQWENLSPLNNLSLKEQERVRAEIWKRIDEIRKLSTRRVGGKLVSVFSSLDLERECGFRKGPLEFGCVWARPQFAGEFNELFRKRLIDFAGGDKLAFEEGQAVAGLFGFPAKNGINVRNYDPEERDPFKLWSVDVEAWPYTSEFQNILAFPWYALYKGEAGGPWGSRGHFGPLMTDYLTANVIQERDKNNNELFIIMNENGVLQKGRADEGLIIADTQTTLLNEWEKGVSLADEKLWTGVISEDGKKGVLQDPVRRFLLRGFFAHGRAALGPNANELLALWRRRDWKLEELDSDKFWDDYFLDRRVALREELFEEDVWGEVTAPLDKEYRTRAAALASALKTASTPTERQKIVRTNATLYKKWRDDRKQAVFDYSDITFGNGIRSTAVFREWVLKKEQTTIKEGAEIGTIETILKRIYRRAKSHGINIADSEDAFLNWYEGK